MNPRNFLYAISAFIGLVIFQEDAQSAECSGYVHSQFWYCVIERVSWVEVDFQTDIRELEDSKSQFERYMRAQIRKEIPILSHETIPYGDAVDAVDYDLNNTELAKRAGLSAFIWTVGENFPVAYHIRCKIYSFANIIIDSNEAAYLGYSNQAQILQIIEETLGECIKDFSVTYYDSRLRTDDVNQ